MNDYENKLKDIDSVIIANIAGNTVEDYCVIAERLNASKNIDMLELNISCPNVKKGGVAFGVEPKEVERITSAVKKRTDKPLMVKLTPNVSYIADNAKAAENGGADCISLINTVKAMAIDYKSRRPILANVIGGLSGRAIKPIALRMVFECYNVVRIPIIGMGGIFDFADAVEFMLAGASAVQVGTANLVNPMASIEIIEGLRNYCVENNIDNIKEIVGGLII